MARSKHWEGNHDKGNIEFPQYLVPEHTLPLPFLLDDILHGKTVEK